MLSHTAHPVVVDGKVKVEVTLSDSHKKMVLNCDWKEYCKGGEVYSKGAYIQDAFPFLTKDEREFLISGYTPEEWNKLFGNE